MKKTKSFTTLIVALDNRKISSFVLCFCTLSQIYLSKPLHTITLKEVTPKWRGTLFTQLLKMLQNVWKFSVPKIGFLGLNTQIKILPSTMWPKIRHDMIIDFKECASSVISNKIKDINRQCERWIIIHSFQYRKESPPIIFFKNDYSDAYQMLDVNRDRRTVSLKKLKFEKTLQNTLVHL